LPHPPEDLVKFQIGHAMERILVAGLHAGLNAAAENWALLTDVLCWYVPTPSGEVAAGLLSATHYERGELVPTTLYDDLPAAVVTAFESGRVIVGHADAVFLRVHGYADGVDRVRAFQDGQEIILGEMKSEVFLRQEVRGTWRALAPTVPRASYHLQGELYGFAVRAQTYLLALGDRASGGAETYPILGASLYPTPRASEVAQRYRERMIDALALAEPDAAEPAALPPREYGVDVLKGGDGALRVRYRACARCRYAACSRNENPMKSRAVNAQEVA
jgi:hypothetical protein